MSKVGSWSTTAGNNNATPPDGWPEGQAPSTVNDCAREMMAAIRTYLADAQYIDLNNTPSYLSATSFSMGTADTTNFEIGRRVKLFDATTLYGTINSVSGAVVHVQLDSGALTTSLSSVAVSVIRVANQSLPAPIWRNKNMIINGQMDVWQRGYPFAPIAGGGYMTDRFRYDAATTAVLNAGRSERSANASNVPTLAQCGVFLNSALIMSVSAADVAIAATDAALITYTLEGYDWRQIAHKPLGLSFWAKTNKSGVYAVALRSGSDSASFVQNFTVSTVNTWQRFYISAPAAPTSPFTWDYSQGPGLKISWVLAAGTTYQATAGAWTAMNAVATSSQVNFLADAGNHFSLAAVSLREGGDAPLETRPVTQELHSCQRYYEAGYTTIFYKAAGAGDEFRISIQFTVDKRDAPTIGGMGSGTLTNVATSTAVNATTTKFDHRVVGSAAGLVSVDDTFFTADAEF